MDDFLKIENGVALPRADLPLVSFPRFFRLLTDGLSELDGLGEVLLSERLRGIRVRPAPSLSVRATVKSDLLNVELGASGLTKEELVEYLDGFSRQQRKAYQTIAQGMATAAAFRMSMWPSASRSQATIPTKMPKPSATGKVVWGGRMVFNLSSFRGVLMFQRVARKTE